MDNKQYNALFSFIWNIANDLPNSRKKGYLILGAHDNGGNVVGKDVGKRCRIWALAAKQRVSNKQIMD